MKVSHTWIFFFFLALQDGNTGLDNERISRGKEGEDMTVGCSFSFPGSRRLFCRNKCEEGNILIETTEAKAQRDRYSIEYIYGDALLSATMYVNITQLKKSDSGQYRCSLDRPWLPDPYDDFEIIVTEASTTSQPTLTPGPFSSSSSSFSSFLPSSSISPATHSTTSRPGNSTSSSPSSFSEATGGTAGSGPILYVALTLVFIIIILSVALLIFCKWRTTTKPKGSPMETMYTDVTRTSRVYEEIREDKQSSSSPVEISTVYTSAKYIKPNGAEGSDEYSLIQCPQEGRTDKDNLNQLVYSEVDFSSVAIKSHNSGLVDNVIYSAPQTDTNTANHSMDASPPLYWTLQ